MFERINNYINDNEFRFTIYEDKIHIINFKRIISLEENYISLQNNHKKIIIKGEKLILKKLLENEILIQGNVFHIEVKND